MAASHTTPNRPIVILIPGIGDDSNIYYSFAKRWRRLGFEAHVISFKWAQTTAPFEASMQAFLQQLDRFGGQPLYLIGISAGGTAAVNAMAARPNVHKVITICSPLTTMPGLHNPLLAASIAQVQGSLARFTPHQRQRILSAYAWYDQVVAVRLSQSAGLSHKRLVSIIHAPSVFIAMTFYARSLRRFLLG